MVRWRRINLLSDLSALGLFDVILLRNVLRNMVPSLRGKIVRSLAARLSVDGVLVLDPEDDVSELSDILVAAPGGAGLYLRDPTIGTAAAA
jgi:chemotaxis protein methyltransferase CheR